MEKSVEPYEKFTIHKVIYHHSEKEEDYTKYIFVGPRTPDIKELLENIETGKNLGSSSKKKLQTEFGNYNKIFGSTVSYRTFFVYYYIKGSITVSHLLEDIVYTIHSIHGNNIGKKQTSRKLRKFRKDELLPHKMYLWGYFKTITQKRYIKLLNQIFYDNVTIENTAFLTRLENITMMNKKEMIYYLKNENPQKYKSANNIKFLDNDSYNYSELINNEDFISLMKESVLSLTNSDNIIINNNMIKFVKYVDPIKTISNNYELDMTTIDNST